jgi:hypothetical protein
MFASIDRSNRQDSTASTGHSGFEQAGLRGMVFS